MDIITSEVIAAVVGGIIILIAQWIWHKIQESRGGYTGIWENQIFDENKNVVKRDRLDLRQTGEQAAGHIQRLFPENQRHRQWNLAGRIKGRDFFAIFWSLDPSVHSYGCWYIHQVDDDTFRGYYLRLSETDHDQITPIEISLHRQRT
jgi:hypothetical protein